MTLTIKRLPSGYWHIRGSGPCNWAQPPFFPCDNLTLREHAFCQAGETFLQEVELEMDRLKGDKAVPA